MPAASTTATARLKKDYQKLLKEPVPFMRAAPCEDNILEWHYVIFGAPNTPYEGGMYHGKLVFPANFPFRPPAIFMMTPSGRFQTNTRLCLSISDYHPDTWNPAWTVSTIITGLLSFMNDNQPTLGSLTSTDEEKQRFAKLSKAYNLRDSKFCRLFPDIAEQIRKEIAENRVNEDRSAQETPNRPRETTSGYSALLSNLIALAGCVILAYAVKYVVQTAQEQEGRFK